MISDGQVTRQEQQFVTTKNGTVQLQAIRLALLTVVLLRATPATKAIKAGGNPWSPQTC